MIDSKMSSVIKSRLGLDVFKEAETFHIHVKEGQEQNHRLAAAVAVCPAGLYSYDDEGNLEICQDGCLECGTCKIACGPEILDWRYPDAMSGVQYRFG